MSFLFGTFAHRAPWSYASPNSVSIADNSAQITSQEGPSIALQLPCLARQHGLGQEQGGQSVLLHAWHADKRSTDPVGLALLPTSLTVSPSGEHLTFAARGGEEVRSLSSYAAGKQLDASHQLTPEQVALLQSLSISRPLVARPERAFGDALHQHQELQDATDSEPAQAPSSSSQLPRGSAQNLEEFLTTYPQHLPAEASATFVNTIAPILQQQLGQADQALQQTIITHFERGGGLYSLVLQNAPVAEWISQSILQDLAQEALLTSNPILADQFLQAVLPLQEPHQSPAFTKLLCALQAKQQQYHLDLCALCQIMEFLPPHTEQACALVKQTDDTRFVQIKEAWLQARLTSFSEQWDEDKCQSLQQLLAHTPWNASLTADFLAALQAEQDYQATERLLRFLAQHPIEEDVLIDILGSRPPQDRSSPCQAWHHRAACSILESALQQLFPEQASSLHAQVSALLQQELSTYDVLKKLLLKLLQATNPTPAQRKDPGQALGIVLALLADYQVAAELVEQALVALFERPVNEWEKTVHQLVVKATFQDSHELTPAAIATSIASNAPQVVFAGDKARLLASYQALMATYRGHSSILAHEAPIASWQQATVTQWAQQVKAASETALQSEMRAVELQHSFRPRATQLLAALTLLNPAKDTGRLAQINTGEGKSLTVAMLAAIHALQGQQVDVLCRDQNRMQYVIEMQVARQ